MPLAVSIEAMASEVRRELGFRARVYPRWVAQGKLRAEASAAQTERMQALLEVLEEVRLLRALEESWTVGVPETYARARDTLDAFRRDRAPLTTGAHAKVPGG